MAKVFDLSSYLQEEAAVIKLGNETYTISDGFNDLLRIDALSKRKEGMAETDFVQEFLKIALGEEAATKLIERNYKVKVYVEIMNCINDVYSGSEDKEGASQEGRTELV